VGRHYYMPQPYPDELIGSVFCRAGLHRGLSIKAMSIALFGAPRAKWTLLLSDRLGEFCQAMGLSASELLFRHTVFPYTTAFMGPLETERLATLLLGNFGYSFARLNQSATVGGSAPRYCTACVAADRGAFGESYWHRSHNLPLVSVCPVHKIPLRHLSGASQTSMGCSVKGLPVESAGSVLEYWVPPSISTAISQLSFALLSSRVRLPPQTWAQTYRELAAAKGFPLHQGTDFSSQSILGGMREFYGEPLLSAVGLGFSMKSSAWPALMLRKSVCTPFVTVKHVVLQAYLQNATPTKVAAPRTIARRGRDYVALDSLVAQCIEQLLATLPPGARITVAKLLTEVGYWQIYRRHRGEMPRTTEVLELFKSSELAERRSTPRPRNRGR
jgi:hypothetical protein